MDTEEQLVTKMLTGVQGCLVGVALGDALGTPWEGMMPNEVRHSARDGVSGFQEPIERKFPNSRGVPLGATSDDWQLTKAVGQSLVRCRGFSVVDQAAAHVAALETSTFGWGTSTRVAVESHKLWFDTRGAQGHLPGKPRHFNEGEGLGNGVLMKLAPITCMYALRTNPMDADWSEPRRSARMHRMVMDVYALDSLSHRTADLSTDLASVIFGVLIGQLDLGATDGQVLRWICDEGLRSHMTSLFDLDRATPRMPSADEIRERCRTSSLASESGAFCLATAIRWMRKPDLHPIDRTRGAIMEAINAGGDADTSAAIVGSILGASVGFPNFEPSWLHPKISDGTMLPAAIEALSLANDLIGAFSRVS